MITACVYLSNSIISFGNFLLMFILFGLDMFAWDGARRYLPRGRSTDMIAIPGYVFG